MILRRLLWIVPVAFGVVTITFFLARVFAGDPPELYTPPEATDELRAQIRCRRLRHLRCRTALFGSSREGRSRTGPRSW